MISEPLRPRAGDRPRTSTEGPHRQLTDRASPELWGRLVAEVFALPSVHEGHSRVSLPSSRAVLLDGVDAATEPVHLHGVSDTSLHLCLPPPRAREVCELGWGEPHQYADDDTEIMVYGPRDAEELAVVVALVRESLDFARGSGPTIRM